MTDNVQCVPYASGDTAYTVYGPQLEASLAGAVHQRYGRVGPDQAPGEQQHSVHVAVWLLMTSVDPPGCCYSNLAGIVRMQRLAAS